MEQHESLLGTNANDERSDSGSVSSAAADRIAARLAKLRTPSSAPKVAQSSGGRGYQAPLVSEPSNAGIVPSSNNVSTRNTNVSSQPDASDAALTDMEASLSSSVSFAPVTLPPPSMDMSVSTLSQPTDASTNYAESSSTPFLAAHAGDLDDENYKMSEYFLQACRDFGACGSSLLSTISTIFRSSPKWAQVSSVVVLFFIVVKILF